MPNNAINSDVQERRFALLLHAGYGERWAAQIVMPFVPLAVVTSMLSAIIFAVVSPLLHLLFRYCFDFCALATVRGLCVVCAACSAPPPNLAVKRDAALKRVAPYF